MTMIFPVTDIFEVPTSSFNQDRIKYVKRLLALNYTGYLIRKTEDPNATLILAFDSVQGTFLLRTDDPYETMDEFIKSNKHADCLSSIKVALDNEWAWQMQFSFAKTISSFYFSLN